MWAVTICVGAGAAEEEDVTNSNFSTGDATTLRPSFSSGVAPLDSDFSTGEFCRICANSMTGAGGKISALRWGWRGRRVLGGSGENARNGKLQLSHNSPRTPIKRSQKGAGL